MDHMDRSCVCVLSIFEAHIWTIKPINTPNHNSECNKKRFKLEFLTENKNSNQNVKMINKKTKPNIHRPTVRWLRSWFVFVSLWVVVNVSECWMPFHFLVPPRWRDVIVVCDCVCVCSCACQTALDNIIFSSGCVCTTSRTLENISRRFSCARIIIVQPILFNCTAVRFAAIIIDIITVGLQQKKRWKTCHSRFLLFDERGEEDYVRTYTNIHVTSNNF